MYSRLHLPPLESRLSIICFNWYEHVERSEEWIQHCIQVEVVGFQGKCRPQKTWKESVKEDLHLWNIDRNMVHE